MGNFSVSVRMPSSDRDGPRREGKAAPATGQLWPGPLSMVPPAAAVVIARGGVHCGGIPGKQTTLPRRYRLRKFPERSFCRHLFARHILVR